MTGVQGTEAFWNGEPAIARRCVVIVADSHAPAYWARPYIGQERRAVEVVIEVESTRRGASGRRRSHTFYLDDEGYERTMQETSEMRRYAEAVSRASGERISPEDALARLGAEGWQVGGPGWGWEKVTVGRGSPRFGHAQLSIERVVEYLAPEEEAAVA